MKKQILLFALCSIAIASCGGGKADGTETPTLSADQIQTAAVETFSAALTGTALAAPSDTPVPTLTASATFAPLATFTSGPASSIQTVPATTSCYRLTFVSDVSIPDNTVMTPGQNFTKSWKVLNSGSCAWDAGFKFSFVGGEQMSGATFTLESAAAPNAQIDISVAMIAPTNKTGTLRGNWRMATASGQFFGDEVYVQIVVGGTTSTATTATNTATPTETPKPPTQ